MELSWRTKKRDSRQILNLMRSKYSGSGAVIGVLEYHLGAALITGRYSDETKLFTLRRPSRHQIFPET